MSSNYGIKVSKSGKDVKTASPKDLIFSSKFDSMKIRKTGTLTLNLPSESFGGSPAYEWQRKHESSYTHNIGDISMFFPRVIGMVAYLGANVTSGGNYIVNDLEEQDIPIYGYGIQTLEFADVIIKSDKLILRVTRENSAGIDITFGARTVTLYYTILYNRVDMVFNLL